MKNLIKLTLVLCLFGSVAFAGDMPGGGRSCPPEGCAPPCTVNCPGAPQQTGDTTTTPADTTETTTDAVIDFVDNYLALLF